MKVTDWELRKRFLIIALPSALSGTSLFWTAALFLALIGAGVGTLTPIAWGVLQEIAPGHMVGRLLAIYTTAAMIMAIAGMTVFGWGTEQFGEAVGVTGISLVMFGTALLAVGLSRFVHIRTGTRASHITDSGRPERRAGTPRAARTSPASGLSRSV